MKIFKLLITIYLIIIGIFVIIVFILSSISNKDLNCRYYTITDNSYLNFDFEMDNITLDIEGRNITINLSKRQKVTKYKICNNDSMFSPR